MILDEPAGPDPIMRVPIRGRQGEVRVESRLCDNRSRGKHSQKEKVLALRRERHYGPGNRGSL